MIFFRWHAEFIVRILMVVNLLVRWYSPSDAFSNGSYVYPKVETIPAIRGT